MLKLLLLLLVTQPLGRPLFYWGARPATLVTRVAVGEGIAALLSDQFLRSRFEEQKGLLVRTRGGALARTGGGAEKALELTAMTNRAEKEAIGAYAASLIAPLSRAHRCLGSRLTLRQRPDVGPQVVLGVPGVGDLIEGPAPEAAVGVDRRDPERPGRFSADAPGGRPACRAIPGRTGAVSQISDMLSKSKV